MKYSRLLLFIVCCAMFLSDYSYSRDIEVKDGDTLVIGSRKIRLYGIDAPEKKQKCFYNNGTAWDCGLTAKAVLEELIGIKDVQCETKTVDLYKREVAICYANGVDLNQQMIRQGMAVAYKKYSKKYGSDEKLARQEFIGIWGSAFMEPEQWRRYQKKFKKS